MDNKIICCSVQPQVAEGTLLSLSDLLLLLQVLAIDNEFINYKYMNFSFFRKMCIF